MDLVEAKKQLDTIIGKARIHFYKPIQVAEILHRHRCYSDIDLLDLETYRSPSRRWRDEVCLRFLGRVSTSSARFQDNLFDKNAVPPEALSVLGKANKNGEVEAYIYDAFRQRYHSLNKGLDQVRVSTKETFQLKAFLEIFAGIPDFHEASIRFLRSQSMRSFRRFSTIWMFRWVLRSATEITLS